MEKHESLKWFQGLIWGSVYCNGEWSHNVAPFRVKTVRAHNEDEARGLIEGMFKKQTISTLPDGAIIRAEYFIYSITRVRRIVKVYFEDWNKNG